MPADSVFLDTNGWIALLNSSDNLHLAARSAWAALIHQGTPVLLTDWIVAETGNGLARTRARERFLSAVRLVRSSPHAVLVSISQDLLLRATELYSSRVDKTWGLVDCASFLVMQDHGMSSAFTNDRHFKQAGFRCLLPLA